MIQKFGDRDMPKDMPNKDFDLLRYYEYSAGNYSVLPIKLISLSYLICVRAAFAFTR